MTRPNASNPASAAFRTLDRRRLLALAVAALIPAALWPRASRAAALAAPAGPVLLTVSGAIAATNAGETATFDLAMLDALPQRETVTATPWHEGRPTFSGPTMAALLDAVGCGGTRLMAHALNDYSAELPVSDAYDVPLILATRRDGSPIPVRDKGPLFLIYPFDEFPALFDEVYFNRSVWQVSGLEVLA